MTPNSVSLKLIQILLFSLLLFFIGMLYWSSLLIEERLQSLSQSLSIIEEQLQNLKSGDFSLHSLSKTPYDASATSAQTRTPFDDSLPNLLENDPFYETTLPNMLGKDFRPYGTFQEATIGKPQNLHPFSNWSQVSAWQDQCTISLAKLAFGRYETMTPYMATKMEARERKDKEGLGTPEFWIFLRNDIYWEPLQERFFSEGTHLAPQFLKKHQVNAYDFVFYFDAIMNPHVEEAGAVSLRTYFDDIESIEAIDSFTLVVRWKPHDFTDAEGNTSRRIKYMAKSLTGGLRPLPRFVFQHFLDGSKILDIPDSEANYRNSAIWAQNFSNHWAKNIIVSCGPWVFDGMDDREIKFQRNANFAFPLQALADSHTVQFKEATEAIWQTFKIGQIDSYVLQPEQMIELSSFLMTPLYKAQEKENLAIKRLDYVARSYTYIGWNQAKPFFKNKKIRQALTMAIDRNRIIDKNLNGLGIPISCPFYLFSPSCDNSISPWPYDLLQARRILQEEGWFDSDGDGIIDKEIDGKRIPFNFSLTYYVKNSVAKSICEYISTNLEELGIKCTLNGVDITDLSAVFDEKNFDALYLGWALGSPPEDPKQLWFSAGAHEKGSSNAIGFANAEADAIIDALQFEADPNKRLQLYHRFDAIIHEEAPYTFLYSPKVAFLYRSPLQNVFLPIERQDLVPGANIAEPDSSIFWLKKLDTLDTNYKKHQTYEL